MLYMLRVTPLFYLKLYIFAKWPAIRGNTLIYHWYHKKLVFELSSAVRSKYAIFLLYNYNLYIFSLNIILVKHICNTKEIFPDGFIFHGFTRQFNYFVWIYILDFFSWIHFSIKTILPSISSLHRSQKPKEFIPYNYSFGYHEKLLLFKLWNFQHFPFNSAHR